MSTRSGAPATTAESARVGITDTSWASSRAGRGSNRSRSRTRSRTVAGAARPSAFSSSVTSNGLPPESRWTGSGSRPVRRARSATHSRDRGGSDTRRVIALGRVARAPRSGCSVPTSSSR
ncbi:hypothetical protein [Microbispora sp. NBC_01389]|uniref:hypothetical protein n=1 Tax=Microbispora sp. NBC_01389 TaxID=2903584 RepID=UPI0032455503